VAVDRGELSGEELAQVSNAIGGLFRELYGRGPTKVKSHAADDFIFTVLEGFLTPAEWTLVDHGKQDLVRQMRVTFQDAVADRFRGSVEAVTGRAVTAYHSQVTFDPVIGFEIFILDLAPAAESAAGD
jgi:uncharacterized protein YbcI